MSTHPANELLLLWANTSITIEQAIGHLLQHVAQLTQRLSDAEKHIRQLEAAPPASKESFAKTQVIAKK